MSEEKYREMLERSEGIFREILEDPERNISDEFRREYMQRKQFMRQVNINRAWIRFIIRANRSLILNTAAAAAAVLIFVMVLFKFGDSGVQDIAQKEILPATGTITVKLASGEILALDSSHQQRIGDALVDPAAGMISYRQQANAPDIKREPQYNELSIPKGRSYAVTLSDGTRIWVNAESSVRYPVEFYGDERLVYLEGEALFDVAHNDQKPFVVVTSEQRIRVLGTRFNIQSYEDEKLVATTLVSGSVTVSCAAGRETLIYPGEQLCFSRLDKSFTVAQVDTEIFTSWVDNKLLMNRTPLSEITTRLQRRYAVVFEYADEDLKNETFSGDIPLNDNLNVILRQLSRVSSARFEIREDIVTIKNK